MANPLQPLTSVMWSSKLVTALEGAATRIGLLNGRVSNSLVGQTWCRQAAWSGLARGIQLQGYEIDEVDVFSWGSGVPLPGRGVRATMDDPFGAFPKWWDALHSVGHHWQEQLPFSPRYAEGHADSPLIVRMLEIVRQFATADRGAVPWLWLPVLLHRSGFTTTPLPCLTAGDKAFRLGTRDPSAVLARLLRTLDAAAAHGLTLLDRIEQDRTRAIAAASTQRRPSPLLRLSAYLLHSPVVSPERLAQNLDMTLSGAGKLLDRAAKLGLVREVSGRRSWRIYASPAVAIALGLVAAPRGRPSQPAKPQGLPRAVDDIVATFDEEMAAFNARFPHLSVPTLEGVPIDD